MNKIILLTLALLAFSSFASIPYPNVEEINSLWSIWKNIHQKVYESSTEENRRFQIFTQNYFIVTNHNRENEDSKLALNQFADMTDEEFRNEVIQGGFLFDEQEYESLNIVEEAEPQIDYSVLGLPERWDWREKGAVTRVKNQAKCGSCWAFSATGALEGFFFVTNGTLLSFSEQQLVDCEKKSHGCKGGLPVFAFNYTAKNGIELEHDYPYEAKDGKCRFSNDRAIKVNTGFQGIKRGDPEALKAASITAPISVGVQADQPAFRFYKSGVVKGKCGKKLNHGVLVVGYEKVNGQEAFLVKNSWSDAFGDKGYIRISTDGKANQKAGVCGILLAATVPSL